jgi:phenylalanyl-tRNA synthetase beta chain
LFEVGPVFHGGEPGEQSVQVTGLLVGRTAPKDTHGTSRAVDVFDAKTDAEAILAALGAPQKVMILRNGADWWHPGRHGQIGLGPKKILGTFGEVHPRILRALDVKGPAVAFTLHPAEVPEPKVRSVARPALLLHPLQPVERDFAFVVDARTEALTLVNAALGADKALIADVRVFDEFIGGTLGEGKKSIAITVRLQPVDQTLKDADIDAVAARIVEKVTKATGGVLRG